MVIEREREAYGVELPVCSMVSLRLCEHVKWKAGRMPVVVFR